MSNDLLSGNITFAGLGSGTDFNELIDGLMKIEQRRIVQLEDWRKSWDDKIVEFRDLNTKLLSLKTSLEGMNTMGKFLVKDTMSSNEASFSATAGAEASEGTYNVTVNSLAKNSIWTSDAMASATDNITAAGGGSLSFDIDGNTISTDIADGQSLNDLAAAINANSANSYQDADGVTKQYVRASVVKTQTDPDQYVLQLSSLDQGTKYAISNITATNLSVTFPGAATQAAADSEVEFNGLTITRSSNVIDDIVPGLTLNLKQVDPAGGTLTVNTDIESVKENVRGFVEAINEVRTKIIEISKVDTTTNTGSILTGNYGVEMISQNLKNIIADKGIGFDYNADLFSTLPQIGITTDANEGSVTQGLLVLDEAKLHEALNTNPDAVAELFTAKGIGSSNTSDFSFVSAIDGITEGGQFEVSYSVTGGVIDGNQVSINGQLYTVAGDNTVTCNVGGRPENGLVIRISNLSDGNHPPSADPTDKLYASYKFGKTSELIDELKALTDPKSGDFDHEAGPLAILEGNYLDIIESIDKKIAYEERRITRLHRQYKDRFARLDATLSYYNGISAGMQSQIVGMMKE